MTIAELIPSFFIIFLAFWRRDVFLYFLAAPAGIMQGLSWYDAYDTPTGLIIGICLMVLGGYCLFKAIMSLFRRG